MKDVRLASSNSNPNFTVEEDGRAFISQVKVSELTGIPRATLQRWIKKNGQAINLNKSNQLDEDSLCLVVDVGMAKGYKQAFDTNSKLRKAGARAFIYSGAGVSFNSPQQLLQDLTKTQEQLEETKTQLKLVVNNQVPKAEPETELMINLTGNTKLAHQVYVHTCDSTKETKTTTVWNHKPKPEYAHWFVEVNGQLRVREKYYEVVKQFASDLG